MLQLNRLEQEEWCSTSRLNNITSFTLFYRYRLSSGVGKRQDENKFTWWLVVQRQLVRLGRVCVDGEHPVNHGLAFPRLVHVLPNQRLRQGHQVVRSGRRGQAAAQLEPASVQQLCSAQRFYTSIYVYLSTTFHATIDMDLGHAHWHAFASPNSWFVTGNSQKEEARDSMIHMINKIPISIS